MAKATETTATTGNDTPTALVQPETTAAQPVQRVIESSQPVEVSFVTGLPKSPATPAGQPTGEQPATTTEPAQPTVKTFTQTDVDKLMADLRRSMKREMEDAKAKEAEAAKLSEQERLTKEKAEMEKQLSDVRQELQAERTRVAIIGAASGIGLDPDAAVKLVDTKALQFDDAGNATNAVDLVKVVADRFPGLVKRGAPAVAVVNPAGTTQPVGRTDDDRRREYFGGGASTIWQGGGVQMPTNLG